MYIDYNSKAGPWKLETQLYEGSNKLALICHPHPEFGGNMQNNIVTSLFKGLKPDYTTMRFNFSGVGNSSGFHENSVGEVNQVSAVLDHAMDLGDWEEIHVIGYSFGAAVSAPVALSSKHVRSFIAIAFPFDLFEDLSKKAVEEQEKHQKNVYLLIGDRDDFTSLDRFDSWKEKFGNNVKSDVIESNHFFWGKEREILSLIQDYVSGLAT
ncbi:MAG: alpha/beta hydrolase [Candidatus Hodarchaeota archaeon]